MSRRDDGACAPPPTRPKCAGASIERAAECQSIDACSRADFPPAAAAFFVDDDGPAPDATHARTLGDALSRAPAGAVIAVEAGTYVESLRPTKSLSIVGRCASAVTLQGGAQDEPGVTADGNLAVSLSDITVRGFESGLRAAGGARVVLERVVVEASRRAGLLASDEGTTVTLRRSAVRGGVGDRSGKLGYGSVAAFDGRVVLEDSSVTDNREIGVSAMRGGRVVARRVVVRGVASRADGLLGVGVAAQSGGAVDVDESVVEDVALAAIGSLDAESALAVDRTYVGRVRSGLDERGTARAVGFLVGGEGAIRRSTARSCGVEEASPEGLTSAGLLVADGAAAVVRGAHLVANRGFGATVTRGAALDLSESLVASTSHGSSIAPGYGLSGGPESTLTVRDVELDANTGAALLQEGLGSKGTLDRVVLRRTRLGEAAAEGTFYGAGLVVQGGARMDATALLVEDNAGFAVGVLGDGAQLRLSRALVRRTGAAKDGSLGYGVAAQDGATLTLSDARILESRESALFVSSAVAALSGVTVGGTVVGELGHGRAINVQGGGKLTGERVLAERSLQVAVMAHGLGTSIELTDSRVEEARASSGSMGHGVVALDGSFVLLRHCAVARAEGAALLFAGASGSVASSEIRDSAVALHVQDGSLAVEVDPARSEDEPGPREVQVTTDTVFAGNTVRSGAGALPLPEPLRRP